MIQNNGNMGNTQNVFNERFNRAQGEVQERGGRQMQNPSVTGKRKSREEELYESLYYAKWSYVMSGYNQEPLGMKVFFGRPQHIWTEEEVDITPEHCEVDAELEERPTGLEIFVLTSMMGWPSATFQLGINDESGIMDNNVYIRREMMRVWYIIQQKLNEWWVEKTESTPPTHIVIGIPGTGKSCGVGSFLLHSLLHFHEGMLDVVVYFTDAKAYLIYNKKGNEEGRVVLYKRKDVTNVIKEMRLKKRGHIIFDTDGPDETPPYETQYLGWGITTLNTPDTYYYKHWGKDYFSWNVILNCDDVRDIKAFVAWKKLSLFPNYTTLDENARAKVKEELEDEWRLVERRVDVVGPLPRYVFSEQSYTNRLQDISDYLRSLENEKKEEYETILEKYFTWKSEKVVHSLVKIVREGGRYDDLESYHCRPLSVAIGNMILCTLFSTVATLMVEKHSESVYGKVGAYSLETRALVSLLFPRVFCVVTKHLNYLRRLGETEDKRSILKDMTPQQFQIFEQKFLPEAGQNAIGNCKYKVLYRSLEESKLFVDGFFFVEDCSRRVADMRDGFPQLGVASKTIVLIQITDNYRKEASVSELQEFMTNIARYFSDWDTFSRNMAWEMIYVNAIYGGVIKTRQRCVNNNTADAEQQTEETQVFWDGIDQYQITFDNKIQKELIIAYHEERKYRDAPAFTRKRGHE
ncbi:retrotransposon hot spot (RHS) protein, putative [Trypanosoma brucei gambiense DAL972]|uniref:Retrotransposon hot spot (RHS) protein, putative n=1 Tax=Trypanosoma brucei gambiense (strain MHOM/CI/86/DAL972) TaxID=679716 RepID=C9ZS97_TRYB9|nr:retrotransposon hot spot (RHS) protein, putative [Trypanosoma brucei gambiense DAL972]CBH12233.1 retrotransposon hot spot (RHS) protein, putative [Trypanosoma brucei gambiense DAL972]|eukprot:XP_011774516.1 retrotransposon hot spot (RHS) protein, putative [Trypanosoma brucei gambiense DAL972]